MSLAQSRKKTITLRPAAGGEGAWGAGVPIAAVLQPAQSSLLAEMYGQRIVRMLLLLYEGAYPLTEGMGVCVDAGGEESCDYRIISTERWAGHQRAVLEWIAPGRRL